jgi:uncharacterized protein YkwD
MPVTSPFRVAGTAAILVAAAVLATAPAASARACPGAASQKLSNGEATRAVFCLVNRERTKRGLRALRDSGRLAKVARVHARDIVRYQTMSHHSPAHGSLSRRVKRSGYGRNRRLTFGEILGAGEGRLGTPRSIVRAWMRRSIHRKAILYPTFRAMGVGAARGVPYRNRRRSGRSFVITFAS